MNSKECSLIFPWTWDALPGEKQNHVIMGNTGINLDHVTDEDRHVLTIASLFNGAFSIDWVQELTKKKASQILLTFEKAIALGYLQREGIGLYVFPDTKTLRMFQMNLRAEEKVLYHQLIAEMLIRELPDSSSKAAVIAPYLLNKINDINEYKWLIKAANYYRTGYRIEKALKCYVKILDDLSGICGEDADRIFCDAAIEYGKLNTARHDVKKVLSILDDAMFRAKNLNDLKYQAMIDMNISKNRWLQSHYKNALNHFENACAVAEELDDEKTIRSISNFKTFLLYWQGLFKDAVHDYEQSLSDVEKFPLGRFPLLAAMTIGTCYGQVGQITQGIGMIDSIRRQCVEKGDIGLAAHSSICIGAIMLDIGHIDDALQHLVPAVKEARKIQPEWTAIQGELMLAFAFYRKGENDRCLRHIRQFCKLSRQVDVSVRPWPYLMELCWAAEEGLLPALPDISIRKEIEDMVNTENVFLKGVAYRFKALLAKKEGASTDAIIATIEQSIKFLEISGHAIELAKSLVELSRAYLKKGNQSQALKSAESISRILSSLNESLIPDDIKPIIKTSTVHDGQLKKLASIIKDLSSMSTAKEAIQHIISSANRITGAERGGLFLCNPTSESRLFTLRASKNLTNQQINLPEFAASLRLMEEVAACGEGKLQDLRIGETLENPDGTPILSAACVPIIVKNNIMGVLYHDNRLLSNAFSISQLDRLSTLASYAALFLNNEVLQREHQELSVHIKEIKAHYEKQSQQHAPAHFENIIGKSLQIRQVLSQVEEIAQSDTTVLISGETGVGKELIAKAIVNHSHRKNKPFITLNCSALSEELIYSELFGHEKGSFTGADQRHIGRFEKAHEGTLFLDEIGDLPLGMQVRLLRVLETKEFERVGGKETIRSDFRLITATNRNLEQCIAGNAFRSDLFYRINVYPIFIPSLRDRRDDIPLLINHFLNVQALKTEKLARSISADGMTELIQYAWPGNVRELKNFVERYVASDSVNVRYCLNRDYKISSLDERSAVTLKENECRHIKWALEKTRGKIYGPGGAAELLAIHPNTLAFRMKKLGIKKPN